MVIVVYVMSIFQISKKLVMLKTFYYKHVVLQACEHVFAFHKLHYKVILCNRMQIVIKRIVTVIV